MNERIAYYQVSPDPFKAMLALEKCFEHCSVEPMLLHLVKLRASQINGCAYCIDMHSKDLLAGGETLQRIYGLDAWRESPYYSDRERVALAWAEALTHISETHAEDPYYDAAKLHFSEKELVNLTWVIGAINLWNRVAIAMRPQAGSYKSPHSRA